MKNGRSQHFNLYSVCFFIVIFFSFILRVTYVFSDRMWPDEALYAWYAERIFTHPLTLFSKDIVEHHPPLFALMLALAHLALPSQTACQFIALIFGILVIGLAYKLGQRIGSSFAGLMAMIFLAGNSVFTRYSTKILIDAPQMFFLLLLGLLLLKVRPQAEQKRLDIGIGISGACLVLLKWSAVLVVPLIGFYYGFVCRGLSIKQKILRLMMPLGITFFAVLVYWIQRGGIFDYGSSLSRAHLEYPFGFYIIFFPEIVGSFWLIPFIIVGVFTLWQKNRNAAVLLLLWTLIFSAALTLAAEKTLRFSLVLLPPLVLFAASGVEGALEKLWPRSPEMLKQAKVIAVTGGMFLFLSAVPSLARNLNQENKFFRGYAQAGQIVKERVTKDTLVVASCDRNMLYHAKLGIAAAKARVVLLPRRQKDFEKLISDFKGHILLEVDNWGNPYQTTIDPFNDEQIRYFEQWGFRLITTIGRMGYRDKNNQRIVAPAIWMFERE